MPLPQDSALNNSAYVEFVSTYTYFRAADADGFNGLESSEARLAKLFAAVEQTYGTSRTRDLALGLLMKDLLSVDRLQSVAAQLPAFRRLNRDSVVARAVRKQYQDRLALAPGQPAPAFTLPDHTGRMVSLSDFRGKVVYLDFWASWCGPCVGEIPAAAQLKKKFAGRDVVFLNVSIDARERDWRNILDKRRLLGPGTVHLLTNGFEAPTARAYQIGGIPSYWIIGRDGRIVNEQAPRPSMVREVEQALDAALAEPKAVAAR